MHRYESIFEFCNYAISFFFSQVSQPCFFPCSPHDAILLLISGMSGIMIEINKMN